MFMGVQVMVLRTFGIFFSPKKNNLQEKCMPVNENKKKEAKLNCEKKGSCKTPYYIILEFGILNSEFRIEAYWN